MDAEIVEVTGTVAAKQIFVDGVALEDHIDKRVDQKVETILRKLGLLK